MKLQTLTILQILLLIPIWSHAQDDCEPLIRDGSYRHLPKFGEPKEARVDYKIINQLLMSLERAVHDGHPRPPNFTAEITAPSWSESPVRGILLRGQLSPPHPLSEVPIEITIQREGVAIVARIHQIQSGIVLERAIWHEDYLKVFPFQQPAGKGGLLSIVAAIQNDLQLSDWQKVTP